jgi:hypothetical protein
MDTNEISRLLAASRAVDVSATSQSDAVRVHTGKTGHTTESAQVQSPVQNEKAVDEAGVPNPLLPMHEALQNPQIITKAFNERLDKFGSKDSKKTPYDAAMRAKQLQENEMMLNMLDSWSKSIAALKEIYKRSSKELDELNNRLQKFEAALHLLLEIVQKGDRQNQILFNQGGEKLSKKQRDTLPLDLYVSAFEVAVSHGLVTASNIDQATNLDPVNLLVSQAEDAMKDYVPFEMRGELSIIASYFTSMAMYLNPILGRVLGKGKEINSEELRSQFAQSYSKEVMRQMNDPEVNMMMMSLITKVSTSVENTNPQGIKEKLIIAKLVVLITALALSYRTAGGLDPKDIEAALMGVKKLDTNKSQGALVNLITTYIDALSGGIAGNVRGSILNFLSDAKNPMSLIQPALVLKDVSDSSDYITVNQQNI